MAGDLLASLVRGEQDALTATGIAGGPPDYLPPEPFRTLGGLAVRTAVRRKEGAEERGEPGDPVSRALSGLVWFTMPRALEPRLRRQDGPPRH